MALRTAPAAIGLVGIFLAAGCGSTATPAPPAPAPATAAPAGVDPCALLDGAQLRSLGQDAGVSRPDAHAVGGVSCTWTNTPAGRDVEYTARILPSAPAPSTPAAPIAGLPTADYAPPNTVARTGCVVLVTVRPGRTLWAGYGNISGDIPGMTHAVACADARTAATDMTAHYH
jgi:hypothetical protein